MKSFALQLVVAILILIRPALAADIPVDFEGIKPGSYVVFERSDKRTFINQFLGKRGRFQVVQVFEVKDGANVPISKAFYDGKGHLVRFADQDGRETRYRPHFCTRQIGQCTFEIRHSDGTRERRTKIVEKASVGWVMREYNSEGQLIERARGTYDSKGWTKDWTYVDVTTGKTRRLRQVRAEYR